MATNYEPIRRIILISAREPNARRLTALTRIEKQFATHATLIDGINAIDLTFIPTKSLSGAIRETAVYAKNGRLMTVLPGIKDDKLNGGQYACAVAHYQAWKFMLKKGWKDALILEDDAVFLKKPRCFWHVKNVVNQADKEWEFIHLSGNQYPSIPGPIPLGLTTENHRAPWGANVPFANAGVYRAQECGWSTVAYFISERGALNLVADVELDGGPGAIVIDAYTRLLPRKNGRGGYQVNQDFVHQDENAPSIIGIITQLDNEK